jgi:hypothetical protein
MSATSLLLILLASFPVIPLPTRPSLSPPALLHPIHLTLLPASTFVSLPPPLSRSYDVARSLERLAWAWALLGLSNAVWRIVVRVTRLTRRWAGRGDKRGDAGKSRIDGLRSLEIIGARPLLVAAVVHLLSWRLATLSPKGTLEGMSRPWDLTTMIGLGGGVALVWGEWKRLLRLFGWGRGE